MDRSRRVVSRLNARFPGSARGHRRGTSHRSLYTYIKSPIRKLARRTFPSGYRPARDVTRPAASFLNARRKGSHSRARIRARDLTRARDAEHETPSASALTLTLDERWTVSVHHLIPLVGADRRVPIDAGLENTTRRRLTTTSTRPRALSPARAGRSTQSRRTNENRPQRGQTETSSFRKLPLRIVQCEPLSVRVSPLPGVLPHTVPVETLANKSGVSHARALRARHRCRRMRETAHTHAHRTRPPT